MKNKFLVMLLMLFTVSVLAQVDRTKMPAPAPEIQFGETESFTLDNGLKVFVVQNDKLPIVSFSLVLDRDPIFEGDSAGYVSIAGQLLRTGTKTKSKAEIDEEIDFIGASLSTSATGIFASSLTKHTDKLLEIMSDIVLNANFTQDEFDKVVKQTLSALKTQKDDPNSIAGNVKNALDFGLDHPYGEQLTEETVGNITLEMCENYYNKYFTPSIAYLAIVGDIDVDDAKDLVEKYFGSWTGDKVEPLTYKSPSAPLVNKVALVDRPQSVQSVVHVTYPIDLKIGAPDAIAASVANMILGGYFSSKLNSNLREDKGYTYGARSSIHSDEVIGNFDASTQVRNEVTDSTVTEILAEMKNMRNGDISDKELEMAKNYLIGSFSRSLENAQTIARFALNIERYNLPKNFYKNYLKNLNAVTKDDVIAVSKKYLNPEEAYILVVGKGEDIASGMKKFSLSGKIDYYDMYGNEYDPTAKKVDANVTVQSIIDKYVAAQGGKEKLESVKDIQTTLKGKIQGFDITLTISRKAPNMLFQELDAGVFKQTTIFNGETGKQIANGQEVPLEGDQLEELKYQATMNLYLDFAKYGITTELKGIKDVNGRDAYEVELTMPTGKKSYQYYDVESGLKVRESSTVDTPQGSFTQVVDMGDYKDVNGILYPHKLSQQMGPQTVELEVTDIKVNQGLGDALFN